MELVDNPYLSDFTKRTLGQFAWKEGDPIPVELGDQLLAIKKTIADSKRTDVLVDADKMTPEQIAEINQLLAKAKEVKKRKDKNAEIEERVSRAAPGVQAALAESLYTEVEDDRAEKATEPAAAPVAVATPAPDEPPAVTAPVQDSGLTAGILPFCPRCGWDMRQKFDVDVTDNDKEDFIACTLGNTRFKRTYKIFGDKLQFTLRSLLAAENRLIYRQLIIDQREKRINSESEWYAQFIDYRLACSVESMSDKNGKPIAVVPELLEFPAGQATGVEDDTPLVKMLEFVNETVLAQEVTKRIVGTHHRQFQRLAEALEAMAAEPSFWNGIE